MTATQSEDVQMGYLIETGYCQAPSSTWVLSPSAGLTVLLIGGYARHTVAE